MKREQVVGAFTACHLLQTFEALSSEESRRATPCQLFTFDNVLECLHFALT
jgi:hypothetical protein